jgi:hypothetical protein
MGFISSIMLATSVTFGQADKALDANLQPLAPIIGSWTVTFDDPEMPVKEARVTCKWILDGKYIESRWSTLDGKDLGPEFITWDPTKKTFKLWGFDTSSFYEATFQIEGKKWTGKYEGTKLSGGRTKSTIILEFKDDSTVVTKLYRDGSDKVAGTSKFTRVDASAKPN